MRASRKPLLQCPPQHPCSRCAQLCARAAHPSATPVLGLQRPAWLPPSASRWRPAASTVGSDQARCSRNLRFLSVGAQPRPRGHAAGVCQQTPRRAGRGTRASPFWEEEPGCTSPLPPPPQDQQALPSQKGQGLVLGADRVLARAVLAHFQGQPPRYWPQGLAHLPALTQPKSSAGSPGLGDFSIY